MSSVEDEAYGPSRAIDIYVDGSFDVASKRGGWAFVVIQRSETLATVARRFDGATNNTLELVAAIHAVEWANLHAAGQHVTIWSDSHHVVEGCNRWRPIWKNNGWKRYSANPKLRNRRIADADLWQRLDGALCANPHLVVVWCKGHLGNEGNESADRLAAEAKDA